MQLILIVRTDYLTLVKWYVDTSYTTHKYYKGHTGATMRLGKVDAVSMPKKQKLDTRSTTNTELVGIHDAILKMLWPTYFI